MPDPGAISNPQGLTVTSQGRQTPNLRAADLFQPKLQRAFLINLSNSRKVEFLFNPSDWEDAYKANYARHGSVGLSHERMQFTGNPNTVIELPLVFDQVVFDERRRQGILRPTTGSGGPGVQAQNDVENKRRQFLEMIYPRRAQKLATASPAPVLFVWPGMINMRMRLTEVRFRYQMFQIGTLLPRVMVATVTLEEEPLGRIYAEDMLRMGTWRPWGASNRPRRRGS